MEPATNELLAGLIEEAKSQRLSPAKEDQAIALLKGLLLANRAGIQQALEAALQFSWSIGVKAISVAWPDLKQSARRMIVTSLNQQNTENGRRIRMSVARGLFAQDPEVTLKMTVAVCGELLSAEPETITPRDRQNFANVFIGKGKPWIHHLDITGLRPIDAGKIIQCATAACFPRQVSPFTQLCLLRWIAASGRLAKQPEATQALMTQGIERWQPKFCRELLTDVPDLPEALRNVAGKPTTDADTAKFNQESKEEAMDLEELPPDETDTAQTLPEPEAEAPPERPRSGSRRSRKERNVSRNIARIDLDRTLQDIQRHVAGLEKELADAREKLRRGEGSAEKKRSGRKPGSEEMLTSEEMQNELDSLRRYNSQLEDRCNDLRSQIEDLSSIQEEVASSLGVGSDSPVTDAQEQFRITLCVKLRDDFLDFEALEREPEDEVFREHYRILLKSVFKTLKDSGISLESVAR